MYSVRLGIEATNLTNQKYQLIQQPTNEINQLKSQQPIVTKLEEISLQIQEKRVNPAEIYREIS